MRYTPHDYQLESIEFIARQPRAGLFLDMGMGKTSIVLSGINEALYDYIDTQAVLIVAPYRVIKIAWPSEIEKWDQFRDLTYTVLHGPKKEERLKSPKSIYLINFEGLPWLYERYQNPENVTGLPSFDMLVIDESTFVKNPRKRTKKGNLTRYGVLADLFKHTLRKIILTGTPAPNSLLDIYGQVDLLERGVLGPSRDKFKKRYFFCDPWNPYKWEPRKGTKDAITRRVSHLVKVMRKEDYLDMPEIIYNVIECDFSAQLETDYKTLERDFFLELDTGGEVEAFNATALSAKLRQYVQGFVYHEDKSVSRIHKIKLEALKEFIESTNCPVLCAIQFREETEMIRRFFKKEIPAIRGGTSDQKAEEYVKDWNRGKIPLLVVHPQSVGHGINLQYGSNVMIWFGIPWNLEHYEQLIARIFRQGQKLGVVIHHLVMRRTIDTPIMKALENKARTQNTIVSMIQKYREEKDERK